LGSTTTTNPSICMANSVVPCDWWPRQRSCFVTAGDDAERSDAEERRL
jgi:hypothetical protein